MPEKLLQNAKNFYDTQYREKIYASADHESRLAWVKSQLEKIGPGPTRVLEIGCGRGQLQDSAPGYVGFDIGRESGRHFTQPFVCGVAEALPFADQSFDVVMSFTVLEHLKHPKMPWGKCAGFLKSAVCWSSWRRGGSRPGDRGVALFRGFEAAETQIPIQRLFLQSGPLIMLKK